MMQEFIGKVFSRVVSDGDSVRFYYADGPGGLELYHSQDCCESVYIESITGDLSDLEGEPITFADESTSNDPEAECGMWTFYKFATRKGWVDIRWYGSSNGYYSVRVSLCEL